MQILSIQLLTGLVSNSLTQLLHTNSFLIIIDFTYIVSSMAFSKHMKCHIIGNKKVFRAHTRVARKVLKFCYISNNFHPIYMKLGMHGPILILKVFVKNKIKLTKETRYIGCRSNAIMGTWSSQKNTIFMLPKGRAYSRSFVRPTVIFMLPEESFVHPSVCHTFVQSISLKVLKVI